MPEAIHVLIADDHRVVRDGLLMILSAADIQGDEGAKKGLQIIELTEETPPSLIPTDLRMPDLNRMAVNDKIKAPWPEIVIVIVTSPIVDQPPKPHYNATLSQREMEILQLVAMGARNVEIAVKLNISQTTVRTHLRHVFKKLGVNSRGAAVSVASQHGLLSIH